MPYIVKSKRLDFKDLINKYKRDANKYGVSVGDLNYIMTKFLHYYLEINGLTYSKINDIIGVLECCKLEFYRKIATPYEDLKITENGDV